MFFYMTNQCFLIESTHCSRRCSSTSPQARLVTPVIFFKVSIILWTHKWQYCMKSKLRPNHFLCSKNVVPPPLPARNRHSAEIFRETGSNPESPPPLPPPRQSVPLPPPPVLDKKNLLQSPTTFQKSDRVRKYKRNTPRETLLLNLPKLSSL